MNSDVQAKYLLSDKDHFTNIEKMMKWCSKMSDIFQHPLFFNWSPPTNHRDNTPDGEIEDVEYVIVRVGKYIKREYEKDGVVFEDRAEPIEKQLAFCHVHNVLSFRTLNWILDENYSECVIKTWEDVVKYKGELIKEIDKMFEEK